MVNHERIDPSNQEKAKAPNPLDLRYPTSLVERYGAKAGILLYVAEHLPHIPQARMLVNEPGESYRDFAQRVEDSNLTGELIIRSSAEAELTGYEGVFPSFGHRITSNIESEVWRVRTSPKWLKEQGKVGPEVSDEISVIVAEKSASTYVGTYLKHPNQEGVYLMGITEAQSLKPFGEGGRFLGAERFAYQLTSEGVELLERFTNFFNIPYRPPTRLEMEMEIAATWHDKIAALPEMDPRWSYQIEFGIDPLCLFQVRPFKPIQAADFALTDFNNSYGEPPIVFGVTPPEGIVARVVPPNEGGLFYENEPIVIVGDLRDARHLPLKRMPNHIANIFEYANGFLQHEDIAAMRHAQVTILDNINFYVSGGAKPDDQIRIISDGKNTKVENINYNPDEEQVYIEEDESEENKRGLNFPH